MDYRYVVYMSAGDDSDVYAVVVVDNKRWAEEAVRILEDYLKKAKSVLMAQNKKRYPYVSPDLPYRLDKFPAFPFPVPSELAAKNYESRLDLEKIYFPLLSVWFEEIPYFEVL